ncbi:hypothetical protein MKW98_008503 [Papaver atlanticum]|uniref:t-SNARE coiled-coil homology domain-containing protein n=1 Tax=Papaver atlanticum TaxID=357466 RepID=A0AAD4T9Z4_9MAGN|nr:hypothetical protein MKW98_008503 [Papaver atlanticum]
MRSFQDLEAGGTFASKRRDSINRKQDLKQAVFKINTSVTSFKLLVLNLGTSKDTPQLRQKLRSTRLQIAQLLKDTLANLKQADDTDQCIEVGARKKIAADVNKLAKDFESVLQEFQKREVQYAPFVHRSVPSSCSTTRELNRNSDEQRTALIESRRHDVLLLDNEIVLNEAIIEEREQGIQEIQNEIVEIHEIFKDLAVLVHEQGDAILEIDKNVYKSHTAIEQGKSQLEKAAKTQKSNSSLTCMLWVIFALVLLIVIIVLTA